MLHFNELYITEDGKHLIVDVEIDDLPEYESCYLDSVEVAIGSKCSDTGSVDKYITVWTKRPVGDLDGDRELTPADQALFNDMYSTITSAAMNKTLDPDLIPVLDVSGDGEVSVGDINALVDVYANGTIIPIKERHIRLCLSAGNFAEFKILPSDRLNDLFIVRVNAGCDTDVLVNTPCGCVLPMNITGAAYNGKPLYDTAVKYADGYGNSCANNDMASFMDWLLRYYGFIFALKNGELCKAAYYWSNYLNGSAASAPRSSNPCGCNGTR